MDGVIYFTGAMFCIYTFEKVFIASPCYIIKFDNRKCIYQILICVHCLLKILILLHTYSDKSPVLL